MSPGVFQYPPKLRKHLCGIVNFQYIIFQFQLAHLDQTYQPWKGPFPAIWGGSSAKKYSLYAPRQPMVALRLDSVTCFPPAPPPTFKHQIPPLVEMLTWKDSLIKYLRQRYVVCGVSKIVNELSSLSVFWAACYDIPANTKYCGHIFNIFCLCLLLSNFIQLHQLEMIYLYFCKTFTFKCDISWFFKRLKHYYRWNV